MVLESAHVSTSIDRPAEEVYAFASDPRNLPAWAAGLAQQDVELLDGVWVVESPMGRVTLEFAPTNPFGVIDHDVTLPSGETVSNPLRVIPNADGCDVVFTVRRRAGMSASEFTADTDAVAADLARLRDLLQRAWRSARSARGGHRRRRASRGSPRAPSPRGPPPARTPGPSGSSTGSTGRRRPRRRPRLPIDCNTLDITQVAMNRPCQALTADGRLVHGGLAIRRSCTNGTTRLPNGMYQPPQARPGLTCRGAERPGVVRRAQRPDRHDDQGGDRHADLDERGGADQCVGVVEVDG